MKKLVSFIVIAATLGFSTSARGILDKLGSLGNVISNAAGYNNFCLSFKMSK